MDYQLCKAVESVTVMTSPSDTRAVEVCVDWESVPSVVSIANALPGVSAGAELYAWGFAAVLGPPLIVWIGAVVVRGVKLIAKS